MYSGAPFDVLSFVEDNAVGTLGIKIPSVKRHDRLVPELTVQMKGTCPTRLKLCY